MRASSPKCAGDTSELASREVPNPDTSPRDSRATQAPADRGDPLAEPGDRVSDLALPPPDEIRQPPHVAGQASRLSANQVALWQPPPELSRSSCWNRHCPKRRRRPFRGRVPGAAAASGREFSVPAVDAHRPHRWAPSKSGCDPQALESDHRASPQHGRTRGQADHYSPTPLLLARRRKRLRLCLHRSESTPIGPVAGHSSS
jgi:hypothetical protein